MKFIILIGSSFVFTLDISQFASYHDHSFSISSKSTFGKILIVFGHLTIKHLSHSEKQCHKRPCVHDRKSKPYFTCPNMRLVSTSLFSNNSFSFFKLNIHFRIAKSERFRFDCARSAYFRTLSEGRSRQSGKYRDVNSKPFENKHKIIVLYQYKYRVMSTWSIVIRILKILSSHSSWIINAQKTISITLSKLIAFLKVVIILCRVLTVSPKKEKIVNLQFKRAL